MNPLQRGLAWAFLISAPIWVVLYVSVVLIGRAFHGSG